MDSAVRVVGLDLSLTSSGISDWVGTEVFTTGPDELIESRLYRIVRHCMQAVVPPSRNRSVADLVVLEGSAFGAKGNAREQLAALRFMVRTELWRNGVPFAVVTPTTLKLYTAGNGRASKDDMVAAVDRRHGCEFAAVPKAAGRYDRADALALAALGYHHLGQPLPHNGELGDAALAEALTLEGM